VQAVTRLLRKRKTPSRKANPQPLAWQTSDLEPIR